MKINLCCFRNLKDSFSVVYEIYLKYMGLKGVAFTG